MYGKTYCTERAEPLILNDWNHSPELYEILKTTGDHQHFKVESIIDEVFQDQDEEVRRDNISLLMLQVLCKRNPEAQPLSRELDGAKMQGPIVQFWATHFVHSLNMATYLGVREKIIPLPGRPVPSTTKMLDVLHPYNPRCGDATDSQTIISYCHGLLHRQYDPWVKVATLLSCTAGVIRMTDSGDLHGIFVPGIMSRYFGLTSELKIRLKTGKSVDLAQYWVISFVGYYLGREPSKPSYDVWDEIKLLSTESKGPIEKQFFKHSKLPGLLSESPDSRLWELIDPPILTCRLLGSVDSANNIPKLRDRSDDAEGMLTLLYRLHFRYNWAKVEEGYKLARSLARSLARPPSPDLTSGGERDSLRMHSDHLF
ncbi:hypothetical protein BOTCAL_0071g00170 [Botryotinia calthae]|uniref:Uncharacterized protein n=1 Tax=Botryotinia calthae TaxID=38488 RepID=A0A4Y8D9B7_9HELO|nr:hypothetical protein BOTCAL_0071g00170 [Botryotinia calthae]